MSLRHYGANPWFTGSNSANTLYTDVLSVDPSFTSSALTAVPYYIVRIPSGSTLTTPVVGNKSFFDPPNGLFNTSISASTHLVVTVNNRYTVHPGLVDSISEDINFGLRVQNTNLYLDYAILSSSLNRRGIYSNAHSGSPQLSLEPVSGSTYEVWPGDIWLLHTGSYEGENGFRFADENKSNNSVYTGTPILARVGETSASIIQRYSTVDGPKNINIGVSSVVSHRGLITINSASVSGAGWFNAHWSGGMHMPNSATVAVMGGKNFEVPGGGYVSASTYLGSISNAVSSSYAVTASYAQLAQNVLGSISSASYAETASFVLGSIQSASYSSFASTASVADTLRPKYMFTASLAVTPSYQVISSGTQHLTTGLYSFTMYVNGGNHQQETYGGTMYWYSGLTNDTNADEIVMHRMGVSAGSSSLYLRTRRRSGNIEGYLELAANTTEPASNEYHFTFLRLL